MLVVLSDTHGTDDSQLTDHLREVIREAELVVHAGDFTTTTVLEAFESEAAAFVGVHGNSDTVGVRERLPATRTIEWGGRRFVLAHGHRHDSTSLSLLARQEQATIAVVGHTHRPGIQRRAGPQQGGGAQQSAGTPRGSEGQWGRQEQRGRRGELVVVNPGSHADPRGGRPTYALFEQTEGGMMAKLCLDEGQTFETVPL